MQPKIAEESFARASWTAEMAIGNERGAGVGKVGGGKTYTDSGFQYTCNRHTHTHTHTSAHVAGKTKPEAPTCPTSDLFLCICWWKAVQRKKDMEERQAQSEMPQKVKFVFQFVFFFFLFSVRRRWRRRQCRRSQPSLDFPQPFAPFSLLLAAESSKVANVKLFITTKTC